MSQPQLIIQRRRRRESPMRTRRLGAALAAEGAGGPPVAFPGIDLGRPRRRRTTFVTGLVSALLHGGLIGALLLAVWLKPELVEEIITPVQILNEPEPAPLPRAIAERRPVEFNPQAAAITPQIVDPRIVPQTVSTEAVEMNRVSPIQAPTALEQADVVARTVTAVASDIAVAQTVIDAPVAPALRTVEAVPAGQSVGPRQIVSRGSSVGSVASDIRGSAVREGITSTRDVAGSATGSQIADVNTRVGRGFLDGSGGGFGIDDDECMSRAEVQAYWGGIRSRIYSRWVLPPGVPAEQQVRVRIQLDPGGSTTLVQLLEAGHQRLGKSAIEAIRAASPFPPMTDRVRCLAHIPISATFSNPSETAPLGG